MYRCDAPVPGRREFVHSRLATLAPLPADRRRPPLWFEASPPARLTARVGEPLTLVCVANDALGSESVRIDWLRGSAALRTSSRVHLAGQGSLRFAVLQVADSGGYVCRAKGGGAREIYTQTELIVQSPPEFVSEAEDASMTGGAVTAFVGGSATLRCEARGNPEPSIAWLKNGQPLGQKPPFVQRLGSDLRLRGLLASDAGLYQCLASSAAGSGQRLTQLLVMDSATDIDRTGGPKLTGSEAYGLPDSPSNLRYYQLGTDFCQLEWRAPANSGEDGAGAANWESFVIELLPEDSTRRLSFATKETGYIIGGLQPDTAYTVRVSAHSQRTGLRSRPAVMTFRTERAAPSPDPVSNLRLLAVNSTELRIAWEPPPLPMTAVYRCLAVQLQLRDLTLKSDRQLNVTCSPPPPHSGGLRLPVRPHRRYRLLASVLSVLGQSRPAMLSVSTPSARPDGSPQNFTVSGVGSGAQLTWLPPAPESRNGLLVGYRIRYRQLLGESNGGGGGVSADTSGAGGGGGADDDADAGGAMSNGVLQKLTVPGDQLSHRLVGLSPFSRYSVQVAARTVNGTGRFTAWKTFDTLSDAYRYQSARLREPNSQPSHSDSVPLAERIKPKDVKAIGKRDSILLSWVRPSSVVIPEKYFIYYGTQLPKERLAGDLPGDQDAYQIRNLEPNQFYFITIVAVKDGIQAETTMHETTLSEAHDRQSPSVPLNVKASAMDGRTAVVSWTDHDLGLPGAESAGRIYEVEVAEDASAAASSGPSGSGSASVTPESSELRRLNTTGLRLRLAQLRPYTAYSVRVRCRLGYMVSEFSMRAIFVTLTEAPGTPPLDLRAARTSLPGSALLSWRPPLEPNGQLTGYTVYYAPHGGRFISRDAAAKETQIVITGLLPSSLYLFKVRAENQAGAGPTTNLTAFMTPDANGYGGGMVLDAINGVNSQSDSPLQAAGPSDPDSDRKLWFVIGGGFGLAIVLLIVAIATVCLCRSGEAGSGGESRRRRRQADRPAKEEASLIGPDASANQRHPGSPRARSGKNSPDAQAAALLISAGQHQLQLPHPQQTPDLCRRSDNCLELRHLPQAGRSSDGPVGVGPFGRSSMHPGLGGGHLGLGGVGGGGRGGFVGEPLMLDHPGGAALNQPGHFRNISSSGLYPPGTPPSYQPLAAAAAVTAASSSRGLASPPRVDAPDFSSGKLSSPHSSLSSSIGSPSKRNPATSVAASAAAAAASSASTAAPTLMLASLGNGRQANVPPDILNPVGASRPGTRSLHGGSVVGGSGSVNGYSGVAAGAGGGGSTFDSQTSRSVSFVMSTEDMTKTLDGLMNDLRSLTNKEFEC